jgi:hypothetical protein
MPGCQILTENLGKIKETRYFTDFLVSASEAALGE